MLKEFGGRWITPDPESGDRTVNTLMAIVGADALQDVMNAFNTLSDQVDVVVGENDMIIRYGYQDDYPKCMALLKEVGLKGKKIPLGQHMPELKVFAKLGEEQRQTMKKAYDSLNLWELTPDPAWTEPAPEKGGAFGMDTAVNGSELTVTIQGRVDSLTAPEFLAAFEKAADANALTDAKVDMTNLEYISSAGLRVLLIMVKRLGAGHVTVTGANELVHSILDQTGYADLLSAEWPSAGERTK